MNYIQTIKYREYLFGDRFVRFIIADNLNELFDTSGIPVDIFDLDSVKEDLNIDEDKFAVDGISFGINQAGCVTTEQLNALFFALECKDVNYKRYVAVYFLEYESEGCNLDNLLFLGLLTNKVGGDDEYWDSDLYDMEINPVRAYKFTAETLDVSVLEKAKFTSNIYKSNFETGLQTRIDNIYDRLGTATEIKSAGVIVEENPSYALWTDGAEAAGSIVSIKNLGSLYLILEMYLYATHELLIDLTDEEIGFTLIDSDLGIQVSPTKYNIVEDVIPYLSTIEINNSAIYDLRLQYAESTDVVIPYIHWKMVNPVYGYAENLETKEGLSEEEQYQLNLVQSQKSLSFKYLDDTAKLIFEVARAFGCYPVFSIQSIGEPLVFGIEFKSRKGIVDNVYTELIGITDGQINVSSQISNEVNEFYAQANNYFDDEYDYGALFMEGIPYTGYDWKSDYGKIKESKRLTDKNADRKMRERNLNTKYQRLLFSTSQLIIGLAGEDYRSLSGYKWQNMPLNSENLKDSFSYAELLHTALYIKAPAPEATQAFVLAILGDYIGSRVSRTVGKVFSKIDGETITDKDGRDGTSLVEYVNAVNNTDKVYYESEYEMTIPSWNGFRKTVLGETTTSWKNLKRGGKLNIKEGIRRRSVGWNTIIQYYIGDFVNYGGINYKCIADSKGNTPPNETYWTEVEYIWEAYSNPNGEDFVVIGIERALSKIETKIKLVKSSRFAYGLYYIKGENELQASGQTIPVPQIAGSNNQAYKYYLCSGAVTNGHAVMVNSDGKVFKGEADSQYYDQTIGIAKTDGADGDLIAVQTEDEVFDSNYNFTPGLMVYLRTNGAGTNISQVCLEDKSVTEDMLIELGVANSQYSFELEIDNIIYE